MIKAKSIIIKREPEQVFAFIVGLQNASKISPDVIRAQKITKEVFGKGTKIEEIRKVGKKQVKTILEVIKYKYPEKYSLRSLEDGIEVTYHYLIKKHEGNTKLILSRKVKVEGIRKLLLPIVGFFMSKHEKSHLKRIQKLLDK